jgi:hypothetical protein
MKMRRILKAIAVVGVLAALVGGPVTAAFPDVDNIKNANCNPKHGACAGASWTSLRATWFSDHKVKVRVTLHDMYVGDGQMPHIQYWLKAVDGKTLLYRSFEHQWVPGLYPQQVSYVHTHRTGRTVDRMRVNGHTDGCTDVPAQQVWCGATWTIRPGGA